jgi:hypothetical protein
MKDFPDYLMSNPWPDNRSHHIAKSSKGPVAIVDGKYIDIKHANSPVAGDLAYIEKVSQKEFDALCDILRVRKIQLYGVRAADLSGLKKIFHLCELSIIWNTKISDVSFLEKNEKIRALIFYDTPRINNIDVLQTLLNLEYLKFSGGLWTQNRIPSLAPIAVIPSLKELILTSVKVEDGSLRPLVASRNLKNLSISNQFATEEYAYVSVKRPDIVCSRFQAWLGIYSCEGHHASYDALKEMGYDDEHIKLREVMITGKGKPFLIPGKDDEKIKKHEKHWLDLQEKFRNEP